jgi:hypothetical protein
VIIHSTRRLASAGGVYTYTAHGLGPSAASSRPFAAGTSFVLVTSTVGA